MTLSNKIKLAAIPIFLAIFAGVLYLSVSDPSDINEDGNIDIVDLSILMSHFDGDNSVEQLCQTLTE